MGRRETFMALLDQDAREVLEFWRANGGQLSRCQRGFSFDWDSVNVNFQGQGQQKFVLYVPSDDRQGLEDSKRHIELLFAGVCAYKGSNGLELLYQSRAYIFEPGKVEAKLFNKFRAWLRKEFQKITLPYGDVVWAGPKASKWLQCEGHVLHMNYTVAPSEDISATIPGGKWFNINGDQLGA